ncbi:MAG: hypothetical protein AAF990_26840 [Bacteroidota bacterium]
MKTKWIKLLAWAALGITCFPLFTPIISHYLWQAHKAVQQQQNFAYRRAVTTLTKWTFRSMYALILLLGTVTVYVFFMGGNLIPRLASFY